MALNFEPLDSELAERLLKAFPGYKDGFVRCPRHKLLMPHLFQRDSDLYANFHIREDDLFILSFPKSGTTWTQEMVWLIANDCDFEGAKVFLRERVPFLEDRSIGTEESLQHFLELSKIKSENSSSSDIIIEPSLIDVAPSPRFIKSHLPLSYLPPNMVDQCKVVYVARNPKDVAVSWYHHHQLDPLMETTLDLSEFTRFFMRDEVMYSPYWINVLQAWEKRDHPNFLFLFYEDMQQDLPSQLKKIATFLGKKLTDEQIKVLVSHLSFDNFKKNPAVNGQELKDYGYFKKEATEFMRKGKVGDWKNHFDEALSSEFDQWIANCTEETDFKFPTFNS